MSFFGKNIRKIRSIRKISQTEFAKIFDLSRASIGSYEEGRAEPKLELINNVAKYFSITIDELINKELTVNDLYHFDVGNEPVFKGTSPKQPDIRELPFCQSKDLLKLDINKLSISSRKLQLPLDSTYYQPVAIHIKKDDFTASPRTLSNNQTIVIDTNPNPNISGNYYYLIKTNKAIYISMLNILANNKIHLVEIETEILIINSNDMEYCFPLVQFIGKIPTTSADERITKLENQIQHLINKSYK